MKTDNDNRNDAESRTKLIVQVGMKFLYAGDPNGFLRYSTSPYDAWHTRNITKARWVAEKVGGNVLVFNSLNGEVVEWNGLPVTA